MNLQKFYTALFTADLAAAEVWYTKLLGRGPDHRPMDTLVQWELFDEGGLMLSTSDEIAGSGVMFLYVDDLAAERRRLQGLGIVLGDEIDGDYLTRRRCVIPTATCSRWRRRPRGPFRLHDLAASRAKVLGTKKDGVRNSFCNLVICVTACSPGEICCYVSAARVRGRGPAESAC